MQRACDGAGPGEFAGQKVSVAATQMVRGRMVR